MTKNGIRSLTRASIDEAQETELVNAVLHAKEPIILAILMATLVEHELEKLIRPKFKNADDTTWGRMTGENGPLSSFSQKIEVAYALGVTNDCVRSYLLTLKNVRNAFAHSRRLLTFDDAIVKKAIKGVMLPPKAGRTQKRIKALQKTDNGEWAMRLLFEVTYGDILGRQTRSLQAQHRNLLRWTALKHKKERVRQANAVLTEGHWPSGEELSYADRMLLLSAALLV